MPTPATIAATIACQSDVVSTISAVSVIAVEPARRLLDREAAGHPCLLVPRNRAKHLVAAGGEVELQLLATAGADERGAADLLAVLPQPQVVLDAALVADGHGRAGGGGDVRRVELELRHQDLACLRGTGRLA